jgi:hypothetical protein
MGRLCVCVPYYGVNVDEKEIFIIIKKDCGISFLLLKTVSCHQKYECFTFEQMEKKLKFESN